MAFIFSTQLNTTPRRGKVCDWAGSKKKIDATSSPSAAAASASAASPSPPDCWKDVSSNIKKMDSTYDATFHAWLKSDENVLVTSLYLHRIANDYSLDRIINALKWLSADWRWESTSILVRHVTADWVDEEGDVKRAKLLRKLTEHWATHFTATLITTILISAPYTTCIQKRETFIKEFTRDWDFSKLSEFFTFLRSRANIDYRFKCTMLQEAARKEAKEQPTIKSTRQNQRRVSFSDEIKKPYLEETSTCNTNSSSSSSGGGVGGCSSSSASSSSSSSSSSSTAAANTNVQSRYNNDNDQLANLLAKK